MKIKKRFSFSWTAIFSAAIVGFGLNFLLNLFALAIGLSIFSEKEANQIVFSLWSFSGFIAVAFISMFATGWVAGKLTPPSYRVKWWGMLYGFIAWTVCFIMTFVLITNMLQFTYFHSSFTSKELVAIRITNDMPMATETKMANADLSKKLITFNAQVTLILFITGALSSCLGGIIGYKPYAKRTIQ